MNNCGCGIRRRRFTTRIPFHFLFLIPFCVIRETACANLDNTKDAGAIIENTFTQLEKALGNVAAAPNFAGADLDSIDALFKTIMKRRFMVRLIVRVNSTGLIINAVSPANAPISMKNVDDQRWFIAVRKRMKPYYATTRDSTGTLNLFWAWPSGITGSSGNNPPRAGAVLAAKIDPNEVIKAISNGIDIPLRILLNDRILVSKKWNDTIIADERRFNEGPLRGFTVLTAAAGKRKAVPETDKESADSGNKAVSNPDSGKQEIRRDSDNVAAAVITRKRAESPEIESKAGKTRAFEREVPVVFSDTAAAGRSMGDLLLSTPVIICFLCIAVISIFLVVFRKKVGRKVAYISRTARIQAIKTIYAQRSESSPASTAPAIPAETAESGGSAAIKETVFEKAQEMKLLPQLSPIDEMAKEPSSEEQNLVQINEWNGRAVKEESQDILDETAELDMVNAPDEPGQAEMAAEEVIGKIDDEERLKLYREIHGQISHWVSAEIDDLRKRIDDLSEKINPGAGSAAHHDSLVSRELEDIKRQFRAFEKKVKGEHS